jgi:hypothetical protein
MWKKSNVMDDTEREKKIDIKGVFTLDSGEQKKRKG